MRAVPIPPPRLVGQIEPRIQYPDSVHMLLPSCFNVPEYKDYYLERQNSVGLRSVTTRTKQYRILDNGACEGTLLLGQGLIDLARECSADEIIIPDVMEDMQGTLSSVHEFLNLAHKDGLYCTDHRVRLTAVLHGKNIGEISNCIMTYEGLKPITTVAIPRLLIRTTGNPTIRLDICRLIRQLTGTRFSIHLLGTHHSYPGEIAFIERSLPKNVRSVDSSMPYNYAQLGVQLSGKFEIPRTQDWLTYEWSDGDIRLAERNLAIFTSWARGEDTLG